MFFGRAQELSRIDQTLAAARLGTSGVLVVSGEPGIGKTALLDQAAARATAEGMAVLRARGVQQEADVPFAGLLSLLRPIAQHLDALPGPQARALKVALALEAGGDAHDRFAVGAATLSLIARAAEPRAHLLVVDDAQWLDDASLHAIAFAARRLLADQIALLIATRPGALADDGSLATLRLAGLDRDASRAMLEHRAGRALPPGAADRTYERTAGNPLALAELADVAPAVGAAAPGPALPVQTSVERAFAQRVAALPQPARDLLALAAAEATGDMEALRAAAATLGLSWDDLDDAAAGVATVRAGDDAIAFVHPLAASAAYRAATAAARRAAHRALAAAVSDPDRRAWHLAAAATGPDADAAAALDAAGERARARGAYAAAASAHERAARLTARTAERRTRLLAAADAAWLAGQGERADRLLQDADPAHRDPAVAHQRGHAALRAGRVDEAYNLLTAAAEHHPDHAVVLLANAVDAAVWAARPAAMLAAAQQAHDALPPQATEHDAFLANLALGMASIYNGHGEDGAALVRVAVAILEDSDALNNDPRLLASAAFGPLWLRERGASRRLVARAIDIGRAQGAVGALPFALWLAARDAATSDRPAVARALYEGAIRLARETGQATALAAALSGVACVEARQGDEAAAREHAGEALALSGRLGLGFFRLWALDALAELELGLGHLDAALARLTEKERVLAERGIADPDVSPAPELVEALVRADRATEAAQRLGPFERHARDKGQPWALARAARARGIVDGDDDAFAEALEHHARTPDRFEEARTRLCRGEARRRARRRVDARDDLRRALALFDELGAAPWAERARGELEATGETARRRVPSTIDQLTPRELQVALVLAEGATTREAAAKLFLSPKTVDYHLRHVYRKLGISDRAALAEAVAPDPRPPDPAESQEGVLMRGPEAAPTVAP